MNNNATTKECLAHFKSRVKLDKLSFSKIWDMTVGSGKLVTIQEINGKQILVLDRNTGA